MKRVTREMPSQQKEAIKQSLTGRSLSATHKANISAALRKYWSEIPPKEDENSRENPTPFIDN